MQKEKEQQRESLRNLNTRLFERNTRRSYTSRILIVCFMLVTREMDGYPGQLAIGLIRLMEK